MLTDAFLRVSVDQDISQVVATYVSTDSIDLNPDGGIGANQAPDLGMGRAIHAIFSLTAAVTSGGAATISFQLITATDIALTASVLVLAQTLPIALAQMTLGAQFTLSPNSDVDDRQGLAQRFLGAQYVIAGATTTAGTVTTDISLDQSDGRRFYRTGITVL